MKHKITEEHLTMVHFEKYLAREVSRDEAKYLIMLVTIRHDDAGFSYTEYKVTHFNDVTEETTEFTTTSIHEAMEKYNSI